MRYSQKEGEISMEEGELHPESAINIEQFEDKGEILDKKYNTLRKYEEIKTPSQSLNAHYIGEKIKTYEKGGKVSSMLTV